MIMHIFHQISLLRFTLLPSNSIHVIKHHFTSLHFITLHSPFFTFLQFWKFRHYASKTLHFSTLFITFINLFLKIRALQGTSPAPLQAVGSKIWMSYLQISIYQYLFLVSWP